MVENRHGVPHPQQIGCPVGPVVRVRRRRLTWPAPHTSHDPGSPDGPNQRTTTRDYQKNMLRGRVGFRTHSFSLP